MGNGGIRGHAVDELAVEQMRVAAAGLDLLGDPLQVFERVRAMRQEIDGILHRHRPDVGEALPDLGPKVERLGRDAVDQDQPARHLE